MIMKTQPKYNKYNDNYNWLNISINLSIDLVSKPMLLPREAIHDSKVQNDLHKIIQSSSPLHTEHALAALFLYRLVQCGQVSYRVSKPHVVQVALR